MVARLESYKKVTETKVTVFASAARTVTVNSADQTAPHGAAGVALTLDVTAASGPTPTLDVKLQRKDEVSGKYTDIVGAAFTQKIASVTDELIVYPGVAETANESVSDVVPKVWRAVATITGPTPSFTFSLGGHYVFGG